MRILVLTACFPPSRGGVERCVYELTKRFASKGHIVKVSTLLRVKDSLPREKTPGGVEVFRFPIKSYLLEAPRGFGAAFKVLWEKFDVLHAHGMTPGITDLGVFFAKLRGKPVVLTYHNDAETFAGGILGKIATSLYSILATLVATLSDVLISSSETYASTSPALRRFKQKIKIIPMGVDYKRLQRLYPDPNSNQDGKRLLFVGQLKEYKGIDTLIEAFKMVLRGNTDGISLTIVGSGPELDSLKVKAENLGMDGAIRFTGEVSDEALEEHYRSSDILILPSRSRREAFGMVLLEAMSAGKPVIASDIPGVREVAKAGGGLLVEPGNPRSIADAVLKLIKNGSEYHRMVEQGKRVASAYDWDRIADMYEEVFKELADGLHA